MLSNTSPCQGRDCGNVCLVVFFIWAIFHHVVWFFFGEKIVPHVAIWPDFNYGQRSVRFLALLHPLTPLITLFPPPFLSPA